MSLPTRRSLRTFAFLAVAIPACGGSVSRELVLVGDAGNSQFETPPSTTEGCVDPVVGQACTPNASTSCIRVADTCCEGYVWECDESAARWVQQGPGCDCVGRAVAVDGGPPDDSGPVLLDAGPIFSDAQAVSTDAASPVDAPFAPDASTASDACGGCAVDHICVVTTTFGGACRRPGDGGTCPGAGEPDESGCCSSSSTSKSCEPVPSACGASATCGCAAFLCDCEGLPASCDGVFGTTLSCTCMGE